MPGHSPGPPQRRHPSGCPASTASGKPRRASQRGCGTASPVDFPPSALFPAGRVALVSDPACPGNVSYAGSVFLSAPSPCARLSRLRVLGADLTPSRSSTPLSGGLPGACTPGTVRASQVLDASLHAYHALCGPRQTLGKLTNTLPLWRLLERSNHRHLHYCRLRGCIKLQGVRSP